MRLVILLIEHAFEVTFVRKIIPLVHEQQWVILGLGLLATVGSAAAG